jgi:Icc-related predicted phosphoesterase
MITFGVKGDPHNLLTGFYEELKDNNLDFALCVGDNGFYPDTTLLEYVDETGLRKATENGQDMEQFDFNKAPTIPVYTVPGNHEDQEWLDDNYLEGIYTPVKNFTFIHGTILSIEPNLYVAGLGKIYVDSTYNDTTFQSLEHYGLRKNRRKIKKWIKKRNHLTQQEVWAFIRRINQFNKQRNWKKDKVIWISHDAPRHLSPTKGWPVGSDLIRQLTDLVAPDLAFYGHYHHDHKFDEDAQIIGKNNFYKFQI